MKIDFFVCLQLLIVLDFFIPNRGQMCSSRKMARNRYFPNWFSFGWAKKKDCFIIQWKFKQFRTCSHFLHINMRRSYRVCHSRKKKQSVWISFVFSMHKSIIVWLNLDQVHRILYQWLRFYNNRSNANRLNVSNSTLAI